MWFRTTAQELDGVYSWYEAKRDEPLNRALFEQVPRRPSAYMAENVFFGASFASAFEVDQALLHVDRDALREIAFQIDAPTIAELGTPIDRVPEGASVTAFRSGAGGWS